MDEPEHRHPARAADGSRECEVVVHRDGQVEPAVDRLVEEVPVALVFNGISHAVMLATPLDLADFALGFALSEGLLAHAGELYGLEFDHLTNGIEVQLDVASACEYRLKARRRTLAGRTGCGLCGTESLDQVIRPAPQARGTTRVTPAAVRQATESMQSLQALQRLTGSSHAAAWCDLGGEVRLVREDVGRHNALDKLIGALARGRIDAGGGFIVVTSRASVEMVQKALFAGVDLLVAVSAPTALAVDLARERGLGLAGFARSDRFVCYAFPERFGLAAGTSH